MTTPPTPEAVEAAVTYALDKELTFEHLATLEANAQTPWDSESCTAARILAAEVERLRTENDALKEALPWHALKEALPWCFAKEEQQ